MNKNIRLKQFLSKSLKFQWKIHKKKKDIADDY